jgi:tetratricopeptide (TPR) repeat protein
MEKIVWLENYMTEAERMIFEGRVEEGLTVLNNLLYDEPGYGSLHNHLGWAYMYYSQDATRAELHFQMAIRFFSEFAPPYLHIGNLMNRLGRYNESVAYFSAGLTKPGANRTALYEGMAYAYEVTGMYGEAVKAYKEAAISSTVDYEVDRLLKGVSRCRRKRIALFFSFF